MHNIALYLNFQMLTIFLFACLLSVSFSAPFTPELDQEWLAYKTAHNKQYDADTETLRYVILFKFFHEFSILTIVAWQNYFVYGLLVS